MSCEPSAGAIGEVQVYPGTTCPHMTFTTVSPANAGGQVQSYPEPHANSHGRLHRVAPEAARDARAFATFDFATLSPSEAEMETRSTKRRRVLLHAPFPDRSHYRTATCRPIRRSPPVSLKSQLLPDLTVQTGDPSIALCEQA